MSVRESVWGNVRRMAGDTNRAEGREERMFHANLQRYDADHGHVDDDDSN